MAGEASEADLTEALDRLDLDIRLLGL